MKNYINAISDFIFCEDELQNADIIIVPGATRIEIPENAAMLYKKRHAPYIAVSGKYSSKRTEFPLERIKGTKYEGKYNTEGDFLEFVLEQNGVPKDKIIKECKSMNTLENAELIKNEIKKLSIKSAIICCQAFHARRVQITYSLIFPDVKIYVYPIVTQNISKNNWYKSEYGIKKVLGEVEKCGKYFRDFLLNAIKSS